MNSLFRLLYEQSGGGRIVDNNLNVWACNVEEENSGVDSSLSKSQGSSSHSVNATASLNVGILIIRKSVDSNIGRISLCCRKIAKDLVLDEEGGGSQFIFGEYSSNLDILEMIEEIFDTWG